MTTELAVATGITLTVLAGGVLGSTGGLSAGRLIAFLLILITIATPAQTIIAGLDDLQRVTISWRRIFAFIGRDSWSGLAFVAGFVPYRILR
jgi:ATP-binding cassette subfamily B protein